MANLMASYLFVLFIVKNLCLAVCQVHAVPYDYTFTKECLAKPLEAQYHGGIVENSELNEGLHRWEASGHARVEVAESRDGNKYIVASLRQNPSDSFSHKFDLVKGQLYTFSAWLQVNRGTADIAAVFKTENGNETAGWVTARNGCWSMLKGGFSVNTSGAAHLIFESNNTDADILGDSISLQPFTEQDWKSHQQNAIETARKQRVKFQVLDAENHPVPNATISIKQTNSKFPLGCTINPHILTNQAFQNWFNARFKFTVFENELKWYINEKTQGSQDFSPADALTKFCKAHGVSIRGHNILWSNPKLLPKWLVQLSPTNVQAATDKRIDTVVGRYRGKFIHWDTVNENMHYNFFEDKLGASASTRAFQKVNKLDKSVIPFLNEYGTIEDTKDVKVSPTKYLDRIAQMRAQRYNGPLGIGLEGHFETPNLAYIRSAIDQLATAKLPIWVTELDVRSGPNQAKYLDQILRELHAHPAVKGIMIWGAWNPQGCYRMCLTDNNFKNLATGDVVDKIMREWGRALNSPATTDSNGFFETSLFHGEYEAKVTSDRPKGRIINRFSNKLHYKIDVTTEEEAQDVFQLKIMDV